MYWWFLEVSLYWSLGVSLADFSDLKVRFGCGGGCALSTPAHAISYMTDNGCCHITHTSTG